MVKLIRLKSDQDKLLFNNNIQSDLIIKPNSKIALQNVSFQKSEESIVIDSTNKDIVYDNGDGDTTITLLESEYDKADFKDLLTDMKLKFNNSLNSTNPSDIGTAFDVRINSSNKMVIETEYGVQINPTTRFGVTNVNKTDPTAIVKSTGTSAWDANIGSNSLSAFDGDNGCGIFRAQIGELGPSGEGFYIGLSETEPQDMGGDFSPSKCQFLIHAQVNSAVYQFIDPANTSLTASTTTPETFASADADNDILAIEASEGKIELKIYNASNPAGIILGGTTPREYQGGKPLYPIIGIYQQTNTSVKNLSYTYYEDFSLSNVSDFQEKQDLTASTLTPPQQDNSIQLKSVTFETNALAKSLGYFNRFLVETVDEMDFVAENSIRFVDETECYLVEALNLNFNSYDGSKGQEKRRNLLAVIQNIRERSQPDVLFDSNSITYIDLNNPQPLPLRNLQFRIINSDEGDVEVSGFSNMTILLD